MAFYVRLRKFFQQNDPHRLYLVKKIVVSFRDDEDIIMDRLEQIYKNGGPSILKSSSSPKNFSYNDSSANYSSQSKFENDPEVQNTDREVDRSSSDESNNTPAPKKSKKKFLILLLLVIVLGAGGYFGYDFIMKESPKKDEPTEEEKPKADELNTPEKEESKAEEPELKVVANTLVDSLQTSSDTIDINLESNEPSETDEESDND